MMKRYVLCSGSSGMVQWTLLRGVLSAIVSITSSNSKCVQNRPDLIFHPGPAHALGPYNGGERGFGLGQIAVDQDIVVSVIIPDLIGRVPESPLNDRFPVFTPRTKPLL